MGVDVGDVCVELGDDGAEYALGRGVCAVCGDDDDEHQCDDVCGDELDGDVAHGVVPFARVVLVRCGVVRDDDERVDDDGDEDVVLDDDAAHGVERDVRDALVRYACVVHGVERADDDGGDALHDDASRDVQRDVHAALERYGGVLSGDDGVALLDGDGDDVPRVCDAPHVAELHGGVHRIGIDA